MEPATKTPKLKNKPREIKTVYSPCQITKSVMLPITAIGKNLKQTLEQTIAKIRASVMAFDEDGDDDLF